MEECQTESIDSELEARAAEDRLDDSPNERALEERVDERTPKHSREAGEKNREEDSKFSYRVIDGKKVLVYKGKVVGRDGANMPSKLINTYSKMSSKSTIEESAYDDIDRGAAAIFWYEDLDGKMYLILERKTGHPDPKTRDKYALIGETAKVGEHAATETMIRGVKEEDPESSGAYLQALTDNGYKLDEIRGRGVDGRLSTLTIYTAQIKGLENIEKVKHSKLTEGQKTIVSLEETVDLLNRGLFAYGDEVIKNFIATKFHGSSEYKPQTYTPNIFQNKSPSLIPVHASYNSLKFN